MIIPFEQINPDTLAALIESFIMREGTDYGSQEVALDKKVEQVNTQLRLGSALIVYDAASETVNIMTKAQYEEWK